VTTVVVDAQRATSMLTGVEILELRCGLSGR
jgi:hypothetical protein